MSLSKHKLKKAMLEKTLNKAERGGGQREDNPKILPFYKLDFSEKMEVLFIPYEDGDLFKHFKKHGPNMGTGAIGTVDCIYHSRGESCPACAEGYSHVSEGKGTPLSKKWMAKDYYVAQAVVINSPTDLPELEDGNQVRIFYMPFAVMEKIKESYAEGIVEDPTEHVFVIKKSKNQGGNASYANSYFRPEPIGDDIYSAFEGVKVDLHDLVEEEIEPKHVTEEEVDNWVEKAKKALAEGGKGEGKARSSQASGSSRNEEDDSGKSNAKESEEEADEPAPEKASSKEEAANTGSSLRDRLRRTRSA